MILRNLIPSALSGLLGSMGFGGGGILIIYLTLISNFQQKTAQGINLLFFIPCALIGLLFHTMHGLIKLKRILPYLVSAIPGVVFGLYLTTVISNEWLGKAFGGILIILGVRELIFNLKKI